MINIENFEYIVREYLKKSSPMVMAVLDPVEIHIVNYPDGKTEKFEIELLPGKDEIKTREILFSNRLYVERSDYSPDDDPSFYRLKPGGYVKLRKSYIIKCLAAETDNSGNVIKILCEYIPDSSRVTEVEGKKVKGIIHWVSADHSVRCKVRTYERLFTAENPLEAIDKDISDVINRNSLTIYENCMIDSWILEAEPEERFQFIRNGFFCADMKDRENGIPVFNRTLTLR